MRVIEQARLWFREGNSDKVYEIDLVELVANQYVVNFRFGRRGTALRDGTKTPLPVDLAKARTTFQKLVAEKIAGGYVAAGGAPAAAPAPTAAAPPARDPAALVAALRQGARSPVPLPPIVMRVAELDLVDAEPALLELCAAPPVRGVAPGAWNYLLAAALARCGTRAALPALEGLADDVRQPPIVRDVARLAIARIDPPRGRAIAQRLLAPGLIPPHELADGPALARAAEELLIADPRAARQSLAALYLAGDAPARAAVLAAARVTRLVGAEAAVIRTLFRFAEVARDGELYALVWRRIEAHRGVTRPFGAETRNYLRRRVARVLRRLGRAGSRDYVAMASALLVAYGDADAHPIKHGLFHAHYDRFAPYHAFNQILYAHSPRYEKAHHRLASWKCRGAYRPGGPAPVTREEAFPALWDRAPDALWQLIVRAAATPVIEMATRALRANRAFCDALSDDTIAAVLAGGHPLAQRFAFELARGRPVSVALVRGALASDLAEAHTWVIAWIDDHEAQVIGDAELLALLVTGKTAAIRDVAVHVLRGRTLDGQVARSTAARALAIALGLPDGASERAAGIAATLLRVLEAPLAEIGPDVLRDLVRHPLAALGELAGEIMLRHRHRERLPGDLLELMLSSPHPAVRTLGGRLLAQTPPEVSKDDLEALVLFATAGNAELRETTRALIGEVARRYPEVGRALADRLVDALLRTQPAGAPAHVVSLLRGELAHCLPKKPAQVILRLVGALSPHARDAGGLLLHQLGPDDIGLDDIARLASNDAVAIRAGAHALARAAIDRYRVAPVALAKLVDSAWDDTRAFAVAFIRDEVGGQHLGPDAIIAICDSIRPEVQALGKTLLHEHYREDHAARYLARLVEHPSPNVQLLVSGLLDRHVDGNLAALVPFLQAVLSQVDRGKAAKARVIELVRREAARSPEHAAALAPLLDRQSATAAISQKHPLIATMVEVHERYPEVALPIKVIPPHGGG
ncbi:MAG TPA: WGR domain-containing protein [Kofleriaceae bacterium]|nr:WGR domain-containing protein [Kofleriaceae bacterium]